MKKKTLSKEINKFKFFNLSILTLYLFSNITLAEEVEINSKELFVTRIQNEIVKILSSEELYSSTFGLTDKLDGSNKCRLWISINRKINIDNNILSVSDVIENKYFPLEFFRDPRICSLINGVSHFSYQLSNFDELVLKETNRIIDLYKPENVLKVKYTQEDLMGETVFKINDCPVLMSRDSQSKLILPFPRRCVNNEEGFTLFKGYTDFEMLDARESYLNAFRKVKTPTYFKDPNIGFFLRNVNSY